MSKETTIADVLGGDSREVVTVEPGLYYPGVGSVRLEDIVVITDGAVRNLNRFPKQLEI